MQFSTIWWFPKAVADLGMTEPVPSIRLDAAEFLNIRDCFDVQTYASYRFLWWE